MKMSKKIAVCKENILNIEKLLLLEEINRERKSKTKTKSLHNRYNIEKVMYIMIIT